MKAKKSFGQHFLYNEELAKDIALSILPFSSRNVLEVGPGKGVLTKYLMEEDYRFKAVELDRDMIQFLRLHYPFDNDQLIEADVLRLNFDKLFENQPFTLIGNFPYNISSQIVFKIIDNVSLVEQMVGMFQKEVAERITATHGSKRYGILSVLCGIHYRSEILMRVGAESFQPPPKVESAVIRLFRKKEIELSFNEKHFKTVVKLAFNQRRKMIRNSLKSLIRDKKIIENPLFTKRPEQLSIEDFVSLSTIIENQ